MLYLGIIFLAAALFFAAERVWPGRELPSSAGWFARAALLNGCQLGVVVIAGISWSRWLQGWSLFNLASLPPIAQGFIGWFIGTFIFYWWHRARHDIDFLWFGMHQIHHSASRIEMLTSF